MLHKKLLDEIKPLATGSLLDRRNDHMEIYRSIDKDATANYFANDKTKEAYFEVVIFGYKYGRHEIYIKYPDAEFYVEVFGGSGSSHGDMKHYQGRVLIEEKVKPFIFENVLQPNLIKMFKHDQHLLLNLDATYSGDFNFLERIALVNDKYNSYESFGLREVEVALHTPFVPIPNDRELAYTYMTDDNNYIIVDQSAYNFSYDSMRCFYGNIKDGIKEYKMNNFVRYKDGGTSMFNIVIDGKVCEFYSPSGFNKEKVPTFDNKVITKFIPTPDMLDGLGIVLAPKVARK